MTRALSILLLSAAVAVGCGPATAEHDVAAAPEAAAATETAPVAATASADPAPAGVLGSCPGGPGGTCCGGGAAGGSCSEMAAADDGEGGCPCQRRKRLIEKARARAAAQE